MVTQKQFQALMKRVEALEAKQTKPKKKAAPKKAPAKKVDDHEKDE